MKKYIIGAVIILVLAGFFGYFVYNTEKNDSKFAFKYGLDLKSGSHLTFKADTSKIPETEINSAMESLKLVIQKRVDAFGVSEPIVQVEKSSGIGDAVPENRLIVELPEITDVNQAVAMIGKTPVLEFRLMKNDPTLLENISITATSTPEEIQKITDDLYEPAKLTGADLKRAALVFDQNTSAPTVSLVFNDTGKQILNDITSQNIGRVMAIFLDGQIISSPVIQSAISNGEAVITGQFTPQEAKNLVRDLNFGALPVPIELIGTETIGSTLGASTLNNGINALVAGLIIISIFMVVWYRLPGVVAVISLLVYTILMLSAFKLIPVVLTAAGIAGFILSLGMAVDANVLIFERIKEEIKAGKSTFDAIKIGVDRAWSSIRDGNLSSLISAVVLYWMSGAAVVKGFALVFGIGVLISMFTAITLSKIMLLALSSENDGPKRKFLFNSGINFKK